MPKLLVCKHSSDDIRGDIIHKVYEGPDQLCRDHGLDWKDFEPHESIVGRQWIFQRGQHQIEVSEVDFDGRLCHT